MGGWGADIFCGLLVFTHTLIDNNFPDALYWRY
jgi:hypothetical protein